MSTHKNINLIVIVAMFLAILLTILCIAGTSLGIIVTSHAMGYENRLFSTDKVHSIDIVMDDWDSFIATCQNEEYSACTVVIDGEKYANIGIRGKGNTSLSNVASMDSDRYSFKLEFDQYQSGNTYHGLDKLCLNNLIQDNTYMKDYLTYQMMAQFGVTSPLCSFAYITVNGEDWGLYLAVEGIEESFLQRNYGSDYGDLYKPDTLSFGGGRGNGKDFNMDDFDFDFSDETVDLSDIGLTEEDLEILGLTDADLTAVSLADLNMQALEKIDFAHLDLSKLNVDLFEDTSKKMPNEGGADQGNNITPPDGMQMPDDDFDPSQKGNMPNLSQMPEMGEVPAMPGNTPSNTNLSSDTNFTFSEKPVMDGGGGGSGMGSDDVKLKYIDDDPESYSNIFNNAKTDISESDKARLIDCLEDLSNYNDLENILDTEEVLKYFVVHNYVVNGDSYTGSMIHNYYLYEENGKLSMIPWDYNLAFGTFQGNNASATVNDPIDEALEDRPMQAWIFSDETYTLRYHTLYQEFLDNVDAVAIIDETFALIAPYVENDPTAFCSYEEFKTGVESLKLFCSLRSESVLGQLTGTIPSTEEAQSADDSCLINASTHKISDMSTMYYCGGFGNATMPVDDRKPGPDVAP